ncbi:FlgD immunoglobulin-like domain containing protein [Desulfococcaceae bacterium HSG9]|nr:FlgD immunoglobulin-like domain containing protein [Desulfococcaceae bacterium HSG9]
MIIVKEITPQNVKIPAGSSQTFQIKFDVSCPPEGADKIETAKLRFSITTTTVGSLYIKNCGIAPTNCAELEAEFTIEEKLSKCEQCTNFEITPKECPEDDGNECTQECDPETGECTSPTAKKLDPCLECKDKKIVTKQCPEDGPDGCPIYACNSEAGGICEAHYAQDCETDNSDPTYIQPPNTIAPNRDETSFQFSPVSSPGQKDALNIDYDVPQSSLVTLLIYDSNDNLIRTLLNKALRNAGRHTDIWNGRNDAGELVPDGIYRFVISGVNAHNALDTWEISGEIIIDNTPPAAEISFIKAHFPLFGHYTLVGTASDEHLDISYVEWLKDNIHEDIDYNHISVIDGELGVFDATALEDGTYTVRLTVKDRAGNATIAETPLIIDRTFNDLNIHINSVTYTIDLGSEGYIPTSDDPDVWLDEELPTGSTPIDTWEWDTDTTYSGAVSHTDPARAGTHGHYFIHADAILELSNIENVIQYVYLDPANPPKQILLQFYTDDGDGEHRAYWGYNKISTGGSRGTASLYYMGSLPPAGKWVRLKIPSSVVGLSGKMIKGIAFVTYNGQAWWDKTTKSSDYNELQEDSWNLASQIGSEDAAGAVINYSLSQSANIGLSIFDEDDNLIKTLINESKAAGTYEIGWDATDNIGDPIADGKYYFQFSSPDGPIDSNAYTPLAGDWSSETVNAKTTVTDSAGNRYEIDNDVVHKYDASDTLLFSITTEGIGLNSFMPMALDLDINDNLFIVENSSGKVFKINSNGYYLNELPYPAETSWADQSFRLDRPTAISADSNGDIFIRDQNGTENIKLAAGRGVINLSSITAEIRIPSENSLIYATVPIIGTAAAKRFAKYEVAYGEGKSPTEWTTLVTAGSEVYDDHKPLPPRRTLLGNLATWSTYHIPMGTYTIRLMVYDRDGNYKQDTVTVEVGRVIRRFESTVTSSDGKVTFELPDNAIADDADLFSIKPVSAAEAPAIDNPDLTLVSEIYEIRPAGYQFVKPCTLSIYYTDAQLGGIDENTLNIFRWNPITQQWIYVDADLDTANNVLTTSISNFNDYEVYYAIMSYSTSAPVIYPPASPTPLRNIIVSGEASLGVNVEIFVNGVSQGTIHTDEDTGYFAKPGVRLLAGENQLTARTVDSVGNTGPLSAPVSVQVVLAQPATVTSLSFKTGDFLSDFTNDVAIGDSLYIQLVGTDADSASINSAMVTLTSSVTDTAGISIQLLETAPDSGVYQGIGKVSETSDLSSGSIGVSSGTVETITVTSDVNPSKQDSLNTIDTLPPPAPTITSSTHPSLCQNTFEADSDEWSEMSGIFGAAVTRSDDTSSSGIYSVKLVNTEEGGDFANYARISSFDAVQYPIVSFDYKIPHNLKVNLIAYVNGMWKEIIFTDDPKTVETFDGDLYRTIGQIENVTADNTWRHAEFNLYNMLKNDDPNQSEYIVEELFFADYNLPGWMELVMGEENPEGVTWYADNFIIGQAGKLNNSPVFTILPNDSGVVGYSHILDQNPDTIPDQTSEGNSNTVTYNDVADGVWYFHVRSADGGGNWGPANHYRIKIDATGPVADSPEPADGGASGSLEVQLRITDGAGSGVDPASIQLQLNDTVYNMDSGGIRYDEVSGVMTFALWKVTPAQTPWADGTTVQATLLAADDYAGNPLQSVFTWSWTMDYAQLASGFLSLLTSEGGYTPSWSSDGARLAFMSIRSDNEDIWVIDADDYAEAGGSVRQLTTDEADDHHPAWSPTDDRIAFVSDRDGGDHLFLINADGTGLTQLTAGLEVDSHPAWSPDGTQIAFSRNTEIWTINADGTGEVQVTQDSIAYLLDPVWSPDGTRIAYTKTLYSDQIGVMDVNGSNHETITDSGFDMLPAWSRQTNQIIFVTMRDEKTRAIRVVNTNGSNDQVFIDNEGMWWDSEPEQSPISDQIAFQSTRNGAWNIWIKTQVEITDVTVTPEVFSPNDDGFNDTTDISFNLVGGATQIDLVIYDADTNPVKTLLDDELAPTGINTVTWDGTNDAGEDITSGAYTFKLIVAGNAGVDAIEKTGQIYLDITPPTFTQWAIQPSGNGIFDVSVTVEDDTALKDNATKLQYGIASSENTDEPDVVGWTDFGTGASGSLNIDLSEHGSNYLFIRAYSEDEQRNVTYSDIQKSLIITTPGDIDNDGMNDDWETKHFGALHRDGSGDFDGDGITDLEEFRLGTHPQIKAGDLNLDGVVDLKDAILGLQLLTP